MWPAALTDRKLEFRPSLRSPRANDRGRTYRGAEPAFWPPFLLQAHQALSKLLEQLLASPCFGARRPPTSPPSPKASVGSAHLLLGALYFQSGLSAC